MKLKQLLALIYVAILLCMAIGTIVFLKLMYIDARTASYVMTATIISTILFAVINYFVIKPLLDTIMNLQKASQQNAAGHFTTLKKYPFATELAALTKDYNTMVDQITQQVEDLKQSEKEKNEMIGNLSHDIKTPVASLIAIGQALSDDILTEEEKAHYLQAVAENAQRITVLADELLQVTVDNANDPAQVLTGEVMVDNVLIKVLNAFKPRIDHDQREIMISGLEAVPAIRANEDAVYRILYNVIENSLKYSQSGTPIQINVNVENEMVQMTVADEGQGIAADELPKIFQRTYRIEKSRNQATGGHGLGLFITKNLVEKLGGKIAVTSKVGQGSQFSVALPVYLN
ncbi:HAMP domain-containing histidine kinase [Periweissella fabaria]|uniref:histidine kinase n=1 Tax=Periweissella fabaria TaxID=546157 RepID=A0ABM8Z4Q4_9LACO|nr:HAMP domain-containing sensor histidine kinase [Periweissella fabaria]MCM0597268.1 HAMP domain-containing histidine kinase [Periweissella fabaria]CAH0416226.1 Histidine protein kinase SaeS [Periweissella fabaria]